MKRPHQGFSLVELMVALTLGTLVVLAATGLFLANQRTFNLQGSMADVQQQGAFTQSFLVNRLRRAGFGTQADDDGNYGVIFTGSDASCDGCEEHDSDRITIAFMTRAQERTDCTGKEADSEEVRIVESYFVRDGGLYCTGSVSGQTVQLLAGVPSFQVLYGVDVKKDGSPAASRYATASSATGITNDNGDIAQVVAIKVAFLVEQNAGDGQENGTQTLTYQLLDKTLKEGTAPLTKTRQIRRVFVTTIPVRNYDWSKL